MIKIEMVNQNLIWLSSIFSKIVLVLGYVAGTITIIGLSLVTIIHMFNLTSNIKIKNLNSFLFPLDSIDKKILLSFCIVIIIITILSWYPKFNAIYQIQLLVKCSKCLKYLFLIYFVIVILYVILSKFVLKIGQTFIKYFGYFVILFRIITIFTWTVLFVVPLFYIMYLI